MNLFTKNSSSIGLSSVLKNISLVKFLVITNILVGIFGGFCEAGGRNTGFVGGSYSGLGDGGNSFNGAFSGSGGGYGGFGSYGGGGFGGLGGGAGRTGSVHSILAGGYGGHGGGGGGGGGGYFG